MNSAWPVTLESEGVRLRPLTSGDAAAWREVRQRNAEWLQRWDATAPPGADTRPRTFGSMIRAMRKAANAGTQMPFAVEVDGAFVGQISVNNIVRGSAQFASIGYWIDERLANRGITTRGVALVIDYCFGVAGLHRLEVAIRPENAASLRVVDKLGLEFIGLAPRYLHIDGEWRDHLLFYVTKEDVPSGMLNRLGSRKP
ncbi:MAG TPA: GNAT family protein [Marmoricola sp.]|nr:GNAT family protein [Marmoricola sp.]